MEKGITKQLNFYEPDVDSLVRKDHPYRIILQLVDFAGLTRGLQSLLNRKYGRPGYNLESGFKALIVQWMEDLSDRELERYLQENNAAKLFCSFTLTEKTPDHCYFSELRNKIGTERLAKLFNKFGDKLREKGLVTNVFTFVDASKMISKVSLWNERDKAIKDGQDKLNNSNIKDYSADKTAATKASVTDAKGLKHVCPSGGMVVADKGYCVKPAQDTMKAKGCHSGAILKANMKNKNRDKDRFLTRIRMPYEGVFSKMDKKARYKGIAKNQFQVLMQAFAYNLKRLTKIAAPPLIFD